MVNSITAPFHVALQKRSKCRSPRQQKLRLPWKRFVVQTTVSFDIPLEKPMLLFLACLSTFNNPQATLSSVQTHYVYSPIQIKLHIVVCFAFEQCVIQPATIEIKPCF